MLPFPPPGDLPVPGIKPVSRMSSALAGGFLTSSTYLSHLKSECRLRAVLDGDSDLNGNTQLMPLQEIERGGREDREKRKH